MKHVINIDNLANNVIAASRQVVAPGARIGQQEVTLLSEYI